MSEPQTAVLVLALVIAAAALLAGLQARRRPFRLVRQALAHPDPSVRLAAVALAADEGLDKYAAQLIDALESGDAVLVQAVRTAALHAGPPRAGDLWAETLRSWAQVPSAPIADAGLRAFEARPYRAQTSRFTLGRPSNRTISTAALTLLDLVTLAATTWLIGLYATAFTGFPKGYDAWGHIAKSTLVMVNFPHLAWNDAWYGGVPYFQGYPPLYHATVALVTRLSSASVPQVITAVAEVSILGLVLASYALVRTLTGTRSPALVSGGLLLVSRPLWTYALIDGLYPRLMAIMFFSAALLAVALWFRRPSRLRRFCIVLPLAACIATHLLVGLLAAALIAVLLWVLSHHSSDSPWRAVLSVVGVALAINAYFLLPLLLAPGALGGLTSSGGLVPVRNLLLPSSGMPESLPTALLPLAAVLAAAVCVSMRRPASPLRRPLLQQLGRNRTVWRSTGPREKLGPDPLNLDELAARVSSESEPVAAARRWDEHWHQLRTPLIWATVLGVGGVLLLVYCTAGLLSRFPFYAPGVTSGETLIFPALMLAVSCGILLDAITARTGARRRVLVVLGSGLLIPLSGALGLPSLPREAVTQNDPPKVAVMGLLPTDALQHDYRVHGTQTAVTDWIDSRGDLPQTGGYQVEGVVQRERQAWLEKATFDRDPAAVDERKFLFDWHAIKWIYAGPSARESSLYASNRQMYDLRASSSASPYQLFAYRDARPILSASSATSMLVVGKLNDYDYVLRSLALAGTGSEAVVPVAGRQAIDDYSVDELRRFDVLFLYGFSYRDGRHASELLADYVRGGGTLVVEGGDAPQMAPHPLPDPFPVESVSPALVDHQWDFGTRPSSVAQTVSTSEFSPPAYGHGPWTVAAGGGVKPWAEAVMFSKDKPVLVTGRFGQGRVIWSGINLPYHAALYRNPMEARLLVATIGGTATTGATPPPAYSAHYIDAERRTITLDGRARGVLFKETYVQGWHASVNGRDAALYEAGPGMIYVPLTGSTAQASTVTFTYRLSTWEQFASLASITTGILFVLSSLGFARLSWLGRLSQSRRRRKAGQ